MRLNEDEPLVWQDERGKMRKREVRRWRKNIGNRVSESRKGVSKERGDGLWQIKMKLRK